MLLGCKQVVQTSISISWYDIEALLLSVDPKLKECPGTVETPGGEK